MEGRRGVTGGGESTDSTPGPIFLRLVIGYKTTHFKQIQPASYLTCSSESFCLIGILLASESGDLLDCSEFNILFAVSLILGPVLEAALDGRTTMC